MVKTAIYAEAFDTVRTSKNELALADAILKILMAAPEGAVLSTTHAIDSSFLLSDRLAGNTAFRSLVQAGRLRIARWPGGIKPAMALETVLGLPEDRYVLTGWPELKGDAALRKLTLEAWKKETTTTGVASVDKRLDNARELYASATSAESLMNGPIEELPRSKLFADSLKNAPRWLPPDETSREVAEQVSELAKFDGRNSRSQVYNWIDSRDINEETNSRLKDLVDGRYNRTVANSLKLPFLSARRVWKHLPSNYHESEAEVAGLELFEQLVGGPLLKSVEWSTMLRALSIYGPGSPSVEDSKEAFKEILKSVAPYKKAITIGAVAAGIVGGTLLAISLNGAAQTWTRLALFGLSEAIGFGSMKFIGEYFGDQTDKCWRGKRLKAYSGWLDSIT